MWLSNRQQAERHLQKTINEKFHLLNWLFSGEIDALVAITEPVSRVELDTGAVGGDSNYWKMVKQWFNEGFPENSDDSPAFAVYVYFMHWNIKNIRRHSIQLSMVHTYQRICRRWGKWYRRTMTEQQSTLQNQEIKSNFTRAAMMVLAEQIRWCIWCRRWRLLQLCQQAPIYAYKCGQMKALGS